MPDERGPRCFCGHYQIEHSKRPTAICVCSGVYATLMADADDHESVEVHCPCIAFWPAPAGYHEVRDA